MIKKTVLTICTGVVLLLLASAGTMGQDIESLEFPELNKIKIPDIERVTLDNGFRIYLLVDKSLPVVSAKARIDCGSHLESDDKVGLAGLCGTVMRTGGTEKWSGDEIDEMLEAIGASVETSIGVTSGTAYMNILSEYSDTGLEVLAQILRYPVFDQDKIDLAKMQLRTSISRRNDYISSIGNREFAKLIYGADSPYARHIEYSTLDAISRNDLVNYHMAYFHPDHIQLAVWGDFDKKEMIKKLDRLFGFWQAIDLEVPTPPPFEYEWRSKVYYIEKTDVEQAYIMMGHIGGLTTDEDYADRIVMNSILGDDFGSRITDAVRTKLGLAYTTRGAFGSHISYPGYFWAMASTKPSSALQATREMIKQIASMQTDLPTEKEMRKGKDGYLNSFVFNFDSKSEVISRMMSYEFFDLPADFLQQEKEKVEKVTPEAVQTAAINNLRPNEMVILIVGNAAEFGEPLDSLGLGPVDTLDITIPVVVEQQQAEATDENQHKGAALLKKAVEAAGGLDNFKKIKTVSRKSSIEVDSEGHKFSADHEMAIVYPDKKRNVLIVSGVPIYDICDGVEGWKTGPSGDVVPMEKVELEEAGKTLDRNVINIFANSDNPYYVAVYGGPDAVENIVVEYVDINNAEGEAICRLGIAEDGRLVCRNYYGMTAFGPGMLEDVYVDYQEIDGVLIPKTIKKIESGTLLATEIVSEIQFNLDLSPDLFKAPQ